MKKLSTEFFKQDAYIVAQQLCGKYICRQMETGLERFKITQTECYIGTGDTACHASKGKTPRTEIMWHQGGVCYVYLCYGIHQMLNFVTGEKDNPQAVLIRGVENFEGPGKATKAMKIDKTFNGEDLITGQRIWVEDGCKSCQTIAAKRVGIDYADIEDREKLWRFILQE